MGRAAKAPARRFLEQQPAQLPFCNSQQEATRQHQPQQRVSRSVRRGEHSSQLELANGNLPGILGRVQTRSSDAAVASKNQRKSGSLVGYYLEELPDFPFFPL